MNQKLVNAFAHGKAFIPFVTCGDPDLETTRDVVRQAAAAGAKVIELGIPFSDPTAEGPVIQGANLRALSGGVNTDKIFALAAELSAELDVALVFMTYGNVVYHYGVQRFAEESAKAGIAGIILPDVPFEERDEFAPAFAQHGIDLISMIAPTSDARIAQIASQAEGFIYLVSSLGVTGTRTNITTDLDSIVAQIRSVTSTPIAIGFGISDAEAAGKMAAKADGAIVGSAIVKIIAKEGAKAAEPVGTFVKECVEAVNRA